MAETVLVDTSIWVNHLRHGEADLVALLEEGAVLVHPFVIGELACGNLKNRAEILSLLGALPSAAVADHDEVMTLIEIHKLMGTGLGYVDVHLLASAILSDVPFWTEARSLAKAAEGLNRRYSAS